MRVSRLIPCLLLAVAPFGCGDRGSAGETIEFHPAGGVHERTAVGNPRLHLHLGHTVLVELEALEAHPGDSGDAVGVDELRYHFADPVDVMLAVDEESPHAPTLILRDARGREVGRAEPGGAHRVVSVVGTHTLQLIHPQAGEADAATRYLFVRAVPGLHPDAGAATSELESTRAQNASDATTLMASEDCPDCDLRGLVWDECGGSGLALVGVDLRRANFSGASLGCIRFQDIAPDFAPSPSGLPDLTGALFDEAVLSEVAFASLGSLQKFSGVSFRGTRFRDGSQFGELAVVDADFTDARFEGNSTGFEFAAVRSSDFTGATFSSGAAMYSPDLRESTFSGTVFDTGSLVAGSVFAGADLSDAVFHGTRLAFPNRDLASFHCQTVHGNPRWATVDEFRCPTMVGTTFQDMNLSGMNFAGTDLRSAVLSGVDLTSANLANALLSDADLSDAALDGARLVGANLNFANLNGASLVGTLLGADPSSGTATASMRGALMINADLTDADLRGVDLTAAHAYGAESNALFVRARLDSADCAEAILAGAVFTNASMSSASFNKAHLANAVFAGANLTNAVFDDAYLQGADFSSALATTGMRLSNAAVSTTLTTPNCTLIAPGAWSYVEQDGTPYTYAFGATRLKTDHTVICPDNGFGPCDSAESLCPVGDGPFPPVPPCTPVMQYCWENCFDPPNFSRQYPACF
jgi:uncharacterized protein YjbI with pentapeptide repeats